MLIGVREFCEELLSAIRNTKILHVGLGRRDKLVASATLITELAIEDAHSYHNICCTKVSGVARFSVTKVNLVCILSSVVALHFQNV